MKGGEGHLLSPSWGWSPQDETLEEVISTGVIAPGEIIGRFAVLQPR
jgi:hypothetical protein